MGDSEDPKWLGPALWAGRHHRHGRNGIVAHMTRLPKNSSTALPVPLEDDEQKIVVKYLERRGLTFTAVPNSTYTTSWSVKNRNTALGLRPGLPDLVIALPGIGILFIEMKRIKGGVVSEAQKKWIKAINDCPGSAAHVAMGATDAINIIESYCPSR